MTIPSMRLRRLALLSPVSVVLAVGLAMPVPTGAAERGKGDRQPLDCAPCSENVAISERVDDGAAGVTTLIRLRRLPDLAFGSDT